MRAVVAAVMLVGCGFAPRAGGTTIDVDAAMTGDDGSASQCSKSYSSQFDSCAVGSGGNADLELHGNTNYNTDTNTLTLDDASQVHPPHVVINTATGSVDVLFVGAFALTGKLTVTGTFPFGIAATGDVSIGGTLDAAANGAGVRSLLDCGVALEAGVNGVADTGGGGGGAGAAFHGSGGAGGPSDSDEGMQPSVAGGLGGARPTGLLGGCAGAHGGDGNGASTAGAGGDGGGAVMIATPKQITVTAMGLIDAGGGGGKAGKSNSGGGGGGGSGGMILLECATLRVMGAIAANGGGGGGGAESGVNGKDGGDATITTMRAAFGAGAVPEGGDGAGGGAGTMIDGAPATQLKKGGGGGGGGGAGYIAINCMSTMTPGTISPAFAPWP